MHTVQHRYDRNDIMLGDCSTYGHDYCNAPSIPDFDLGWKVSAVQGIAFCITVQLPYFDNFPCLLIRIIISFCCMMGVEASTNWIGILEVLYKR